MCVCDTRSSSRSLETDHVASDTSRVGVDSRKLRRRASRSGPRRGGNLRGNNDREIGVFFRDIKGFIPMQNSHETIRKYEIVTPNNI